MWYLLAVWAIELPADVRPVETYQTRHECVQAAVDSGYDYPFMDSPGRIFLDDDDEDDRFYLVCTVAQSNAKTEA